MADSGGGVAVIVAPAETGAEGAVLVLVEVEVVRGVSGLRADVTAAEPPVFATFSEGRALKGRDNGISQSYYKSQTVQRS